MFDKEFEIPPYIHGNPVRTTKISSLAKQLKQPDRNYPSALHHPNENTAQDVETGSNLVFVVQGKISLEAVEDKILILNDRFKSGYECDLCDATGTLAQCKCVTEGHPGENRLGGICPICTGIPEKMINKDCPKCKGAGVTLIIPESTKQTPTSGVIVSIGPDVKRRRLGERVLYGAHVGYALPFKGNVRVRIMREHEILCLMDKIDPNATTEDFKIMDEPIDNRSGVMP